MAETLSYELPTYLARRQAARRRERLVQLVALAIAAAGIVGASQFVEPMNRIRTERQLVMDPDTIKGLPPLETLLAKTGTFRALAIDVAFIRLERLKEEGKFYELMQLASWICKLAPQFPSVWVYHAWNQAYNISVATYTAEERWKWVNNGIRLLRDEGIQYNPKSVTLYKELAWFYWHKIGDFLDDHHWNYKRELAVEMELVLGPPPAVISEQEVLDAFRQIVDAPRDLAVMLEQDPEVAELVGRLDELNLAADTGLLEFVARHLRSELSVKRYLKSQPGDEAPTLHARRVGLLSDPSNAEARERLLAALRSQALRVDYHMDLEWMLTLMEKYGPIDWRSPYAMCLYWASWGDITTAGQLNLNVNDSMNTARFIFFALDNMVKRGKIVLTPNFDKPNESFLELLPDARFIDHYHETVIGLSKMQFPYDPAVERGEPAGNYRVGHFNFLTYAVQQLYLQGDQQSLAKAKEYYAYLRRVNRSPDVSAAGEPLSRRFAKGDVPAASGGVRAQGYSRRRRGFQERQHADQRADVSLIVGAGPGRHRAERRDDADGAAGVRLLYGGQTGGPQPAAQAGDAAHPAGRRGRLVPAESSRLARTQDAALAGPGAEDPPDRLGPDRASLG
ncbi:MAG: hypothetical protein ACYSUQ_06805 [Planctomycetota bacterium]|jgi:hypothetical protein